MNISEETLLEIAALPPESIPAVLRILARQAAQKAKASDRQKRHRERRSGVTSNVTGDVNVDVTCGVTPPLKEKSPTPPKENNPPVSHSEANASSFETRAGTTSAPMARLEFDSEFWPHYPHKVGRAKAVEAYVVARRKATLPEILGGLDRYKASRRDGQPWLNPATFLNQERWNDEPAPISQPNRLANGRSAHDTILGALARAATKCDRDSEWPPYPDDGILDLTIREDADRGNDQAATGSRRTWS